MPEEMSEMLVGELAEMDNNLKNMTDRWEKQTIAQDELTEKNRFYTYSDKNWKEGVIGHYKRLQGEFDKLPVKLLHTREGFDIEIINPIEHDHFRVYSILTPLVLDVIIEFKIDLDPHQSKSAHRNWTRVSALTNEKSRWVCAGTSLVDRHTKEGLISMGTHWSDNAFAEVLRIVYYKVHKEIKEAENEE